MILVEWFNRSGVCCSVTWTGANNCNSNHNFIMDFWIRNKYRLSRDCIAILSWYICRLYTAPRIECKFNQKSSRLTAITTINRKYGTRKQFKYDRSSYLEWPEINTYWFYTFGTSRTFNRNLQFRNSRWTDLNSNSKTLVSNENIPHEQC